MAPWQILAVISAYFALLLFIAWRTSRGAGSASFYIGDRSSQWYLVAFGMIGASLSGITFISVPGWVGSSQFSYMQMVFGYLAGYAVIGLLLMPVYYKLGLVSIYTYLKDRFGTVSHKTGAFFFLLSRVLGASFRLYLVAIVMQRFIFEPMGVPFWLAVLLTIGLIWLYTFRGGIRTIVYTDTLQTAFMLLALFATLGLLMSEMDIGLLSLSERVESSGFGRIWFLDPAEWKGTKFFPKQFFGGMFIAICMTGLDQDMMQKNLSCRNIGDAQKNMFWFSIVLVFVNLFFLLLGALLFMYSEQFGIEIPTKLVNGEAVPANDLLFPEIALRHMPLSVSLAFIVGLTAAAYSSADSALTSLTTSFCIDFLGLNDKPGGDSADDKRTRWWVHIGFSVLLFILILLFNRISRDSVISELFRVATFTYGPLLGLFSFGLLSRRKPRDRWVWLVCLLPPFLCLLLDQSFCRFFEGIGSSCPGFISGTEQWIARLLNGYDFGYEILLINGLLTFLGLFLISRPADKADL